MSEAVFPVQVPNLRYSAPAPFIPSSVHLMAYEVYKHLYGEQNALISGNARGGFCLSELVSFLYAYSFPQSEWRQRVNEARKGMSL